MIELEIFRNTEWFFGFLVISLVGSGCRTAFTWKYLPKELTIKNTIVQVIFGLIICFIGEIILKTFNYQNYRVFLFFASLISEDILLKIMKNKSPLLDKIFNKIIKSYSNEK